MIKKLEKEFTKKGMRFEQVLDEELFYAYKVTDKDWQGNDIHWYEVFQKRTKPLKDDSEYEAQEIYPKNESFGDWAFCDSNLKALVKMLKGRLQ